MIDTNRHVVVTSIDDIAVETEPVPTAWTGQYGGSLFEQSTLLLLDAVILDLTAGDAQAYAVMQARHANLQ
jgi:6-phospho-3-hexuloisomerase